MKKMLASLAILGWVVVFSGFAQALPLPAAYCPDYSPQTVIMKGTLGDDFNFNVIATATDATNCFAWANQKTKYDVFVVICYEAVNCTQCPIELAPSDANPTGVYAFLVDRKAKTVLYGEVPGEAIDLICMGENNVGLHAYLFTPYGLLDIVAAGKRDCQYGLHTFDGVYGEFDLIKPFNPYPCPVANYVRSGKMSLHRDDMTRKALGAGDKWCPECIPAACDKAVAILTAYVEKRFKSIEDSPHGYLYIPWFLD